MKVTTTFRSPGCEIRFYTDHSNAFAIDNAGMMRISTEDPVRGIDYFVLGDGSYLKITGIDMV